MSQMIIPFCIYHYIDIQTNTYRGFITNSTKIKDKDKTKFECVTSSGYEEQWKFYHKFYAFSPMLKPIPAGLKLINAQKLGHFPYDTKDVSFSYDPFDVDDTSVSFLTWTTTAPGTIPLFIWSTPSGIFPTFERVFYNNQKGKENWKLLDVSPLYVLTDPTGTGIKFDSNKVPIPQYKKNSEGIPEFKFSGYDGRCLPDPNGDTMQKCFLLLDEDIYYRPDHTDGPVSLLNWIKANNKLYKNKQDKNRLHTFFKNISPIFIAIFIVILLISLIVCIITLSK